MEKHIYITNGVARCGKDTFAKLLNEFVPTIKYSSIDKVKDIACTAVTVGLIVFNLLK